MTNGRLIAGIIILISSAYWPLTGIVGWEWIIFLAQIAIGLFLIMKGRVRASAKVRKLE
jgi:hypothetical protein